jgi:S-adenosylmethionine decarboxylase
MAGNKAFPEFEKTSFIIYNWGSGRGRDRTGDGLGTLGRHYLLDLKECNKDRLDDVEFIKDVLAHVAREARTSVIGESFHRFEPQGLSGAVLITGAHLCIHTWPEYGYAAIDIFLHGDSFSADEAARLIVERLESKDPSIVELKRGF